MTQHADAVVMVDRSGRIVHWDDTATALLGHIAQVVLGQSVEVIIPDEFRAGHREGLARFMSGGERHLVGAAINLAVLTANGSVLAFPARFHHLDTPHGEPFGAILVFSRRSGHEQPWTPIDPAPS